MGKKHLDLMLQTTWLDLVERSHAATLGAAEPGIIVEKKKNDRTYLYRRAWDREAGKQRDTYLGTDSPELRARLAQAEIEKAAHSGRGQVVRSLVRAGLPAPAPAVGKLLAALTEAGIFRLRAVLVGTHAFATYGPMLGVRLPGTLQATLDVDIAQPPDVSLAVGETMEPPLLDALRKADAGFAAIDGLDRKEWPWRLASPSGLRVEILSSLRGPGGKGGVVKLPALQPGGLVLSFMDYLIRDPVPAVVLYGPGVAVTVPAPARYAVHKLIIAARRSGPGVPKARKDAAQAGNLIGAMSADRTAELAEAWVEAWDRGPAWREALQQGVAMLDTDTRAILGGVVDLPPAASKQTSRASTHR